MNWLRPNEVEDAALAEVAGTLQAAAVAAPPSPRAGAIRAELLASLEAERPRLSIPGALAFVAVLLLAVAIVIAAPAVGSFLERLDDVPPAPVPIPSPSLPEPEPDDPASASKRLATLERSEATPAPSATAEPAGGAGGPIPAEAAGPTLTDTPAATDDSAGPIPSAAPEPTAPGRPAAPDPTATPNPTPSGDLDEDVSPCVDLPLLPCLPVPLVSPILGQ